MRRRKKKIELEDYYCADSEKGMDLGHHHQWLLMTKGGVTIRHFCLLINVHPNTSEVFLPQNQIW